MYASQIVRGREEETNGGRKRKKRLGKESNREWERESVGWR